MSRTTRARSRGVVTAFMAGGSRAGVEIVQDGVDDAIQQRQIVVVQDRVAALETGRQFGLGQGNGPLPLMVFVADISLKAGIECSLAFGV